MSFHLFVLHCLLKEYNIHEKEMLILELFLGGYSMSVSYMDLLVSKNLILTPLKQTMIVKCINKCKPMFVMTEIVE